MCVRVRSLWYASHYHHARRSWSIDKDGRGGGLTEMSEASMIDMKCWFQWERERKVCGGEMEG